MTGPLAAIWPHDRRHDSIDIERMAAELAGLPGVAAVTLGGSRSRGEHRTDSDRDIGAYGALSRAAAGRAARSPRPLG